VITAGADSRKIKSERHVKALEALITDQRVLIIGSIRQKILSGYRKEKLCKFEY